MGPHYSRLGLWHCIVILCQCVFLFYDVWVILVSYYHLLNSEYCHFLKNSSASHLPYWMSWIIKPLQILNLDSLHGLDTILHPFWNLVLMHIIYLFYIHPGHLYILPPTVFFFFFLTILLLILWHFRAESTQIRAFLFNPWFSNCSKERFSKALKYGPEGRCNECVFHQPQVLL